MKRIVTKYEFEMAVVNLPLKTLIDKIREVPGDIVELGVWTGLNSCQFMWQIPEKRYVGFDTFNGYTEEDIETSPNKEGLLANNERWNHSKKETVEMLQNFKDSHSLGEYEIIEGDLKQTLPKYIEEGKMREVAMLYVDCNAYLPAIRGIEAVYPIMSKGAIICIDEHQAGGETKAILEAADKYGLEVIDPVTNEEIILNNTIKRIEAMNKICEEAKDKPFEYCDEFYHIHGHHRGRWDSL